MSLVLCTASLKQVTWEFLSDREALNFSRSKSLRRISETLAFAGLLFKSELLFLAFSQDFAAIGCDGQGMLPLGRQAPVSRGDSPAVTAGEFGMPGAGINHGFNSEGHSFFYRQPRVRLPVMQHLGLLVKYLADSVTAVLSYHRITICFRVGLDDVTDIPEGDAWLDDVDGLVEAFLGDSDQFAGMRSNVAHQKHLAGVTVVAILDDGNINVDDIAFFRMAASSGMP